MSINDLYALSDQIWDLRLARNKLANDLIIEAFRQEQPHLVVEVKEQDHVQDE